MREGENPEVGRVSGYRKLDDDELALVNELKAAGNALEVLLAKVEPIVRDSEADGLAKSVRLRSLALAKTNLQQGFMWAIRAVADPKGFA